MANLSKAEYRLLTQLLKENEQLKLALNQAEGQVEFWTTSESFPSEQTKEYDRLVDIPPDERTDKEKEQLRMLARLIMSQSDWCPRCLKDY